MTYTSVAQVQALIASYPIGASSKVTPTQVQLMMGAVSDEIDVALASNGISTPITNPAGFVSRLAILNAYGTAAMVLKSGYPEATGSGADPAYAFWEARYQAGLKSLFDGSGIPNDVLVLTGTGSIQPSSYFTRNPDEEEILGDLEGASMFKTGMQF